MASIASKFRPKRISNLIVIARTLSTESQTQKLTRIADDLLSLTKIERHDYAILLSHKFGFNKFGPAGSGVKPGSGQTSAGPGAAEPKKEKSAFDIKLEKFDPAVKLKIIKEVRSFTTLGLKEAKDLVDKAPVVIKNGVPKEEADSIVEKLKALGATVVLE